MNALDLVSSIGSTTGTLAKRMGGGTADLARVIGPKRGLIGLATVGALVAGGIILGKFLQRRAHELESMDASEKAARASKKIANGVNRRVKKVADGVEAITH